MKPWAINNQWTLFLDRDGVINQQVMNGYVNSLDTFQFLDGAVDAMARLSTRFGRLIVVTNQRGIGRGLTHAEEVEKIHAYIRKTTMEAGGRLDAFYVCPDVDASSFNRKPNPGMGLQAKQDFPGIDFAKSIMVGNSLSDMAFGKKLGMATVFLTTTQTAPASLADHGIDLVFPDLQHFATAI